MRKQLGALLLAATILQGSMYPCNVVDAKAVKASADKETLYQVATLQSLMQGDYYGSITVKDLKKYGNTGLGTFDGLNGEMIVIDGNVYQALADGTVKKSSDKTTVPFSNVTSFENDFSVDLKDVTSMEELKNQLTKAVDNQNKNDFYMVKITGEFKKVQVRSVYKQKEPYKDLNTVMKTDQTFYDYNDIKGTIVALYCPNYMDGLNATGWHLHFISKDKKKGGHMLDVVLDRATAKVDTTTSFNMALPQDKHFKDLDLKKDLSNEIEKVEGK